MPSQIARKHWLMFLVVVLGAFVVLGPLALRPAMAEDEETVEETETTPETDALREALGYEPGEVVELASELAPVTVPELQITATPEEEHAAYLERRREAITVEEAKLVALKGEVEAELEELKKIRAEVTARLAREDAGLVAKVAKLIKIYDKMPIAKLTKVLEQQPEPLRIKLLYHMKEKRVSEILAALGPADAARISRLLLDKQTK
jgi:flagellar motility protein MotE (MotC chaperone)